ncbi:hypothetical protein QUF74_15680 [Candidatus Halobeggiatoa sp. HSG11]|nr:hypothetical protein [Candidatus Halobeggiatoa sp. HSG11]
MYFFLVPMHQRGNSVKTHQRLIITRDASASKMGYHAGAWEPEKIRTGKQSGLTEFFTECGGRLVKFFKWKFRLSHEDAEEALQETLIRFVNSVRGSKFRGDASICAFLSTIGVNECLRILKVKGRYSNIPIFLYH